jgi:integrase
VTAARRRSRGEGHVGSYSTAKGQRWFWKATITMPDGSKKVVWKRGYLTKKAAQAALREALTAADKGAYTEPSKRNVESWLTEWLAGLRLAPSTMASYRKNIRLHVVPYIGGVPLAALTSARLTALYRELETAGRHDGGGGLSARTVRYIHTISGAALAAAVDAEPPMIVRRPAAKASPQPAKPARPPEMHPWTAGAGDVPGLVPREQPAHAAWHFGLYRHAPRRALALRWRDIDTDARDAIARSVGVVRNKGEGAEIREAAPKTDRSRRGIDIDPATEAVLRAWKRERGELSLALARPGAPVFSDLEGGHLHPERFWRTWKATVARCRAGLGEDAPPVITIHDLRHTHASLLLSARAGQDRLGAAGPRQRHRHPDGLRPRDAR